MTTDPKVAQRDELVIEILRHEPVAVPFFNLHCKCGYVGEGVSKNGDFERHLAGELVVAGYAKPGPDVCPYDCDSCHGEECPCDRMGCEGDGA